MKRPVHIENQTYVKVALYALLLAGIFYTSHRVMIGWWRGEDYTYCYLIAPIVLYLIWEKREELAKVQARASWAGLAPLAFGIFLFWLGELAGEFTTMYFASWLVLVGLLLMHLGWDKLKCDWSGFDMLVVYCYSVVQMDNITKIGNIYGASDY